jgi:hypothetical protein
MFWSPRTTPLSATRKQRSETQKKIGRRKNRAERIGYFIAKVESFIEPDYGIEVAETPISEIEDDPSEIESKTPRRPA